MNKLDIYVETFKMLDKKTMKEEFWDDLCSYCKELGCFCGEMLEGDETKITKTQKELKSKTKPYEETITKWRKRYENLKDEIKKNKELDENDKMILGWGLEAINHGTLFYIDNEIGAKFDKVFQWAKNYHPLINDKERKEIESLQTLINIDKSVPSFRYQVGCTDNIKREIGDYYKEIAKKL